MNIELEKKKKLLLHLKNTFYPQLNLLGELLVVLESAGQLLVGILYCTEVHQECHDLGQLLLVARSRFREVYQRKWEFLLKTLFHLGPGFGDGGAVETPR